MPCFTIPLHEHNDCHEPAGSSKGGQFCSGEGLASSGSEAEFRQIGVKLWKAYADYLTEQAGGEFTFSPADAEQFIEEIENDDTMAEEMKYIAETLAPRVLSPRELRALLQDSVTVAFRGSLSLAGPGDTNVVYHGTSSQDAAKIRASGKLTPRGAKPGNWAAGAFGGNPSNPELVYTTTDRSAAAEYAQEITRRQKGTGVGEVLRLVPDWTRAVPDEDVVAGFLFAHRPRS